MSRIRRFRAPKSDLGRLLTARPRGRAPFFHGRHDELSRFKEALLDAHESKGGSIFLAQGPPGAGKSALLHECRKLGQAAGWHIAKVKGRALHDPGELAEQLGVLRADKVVEQDSGGGKIGVRAGVEFGLHGQAGQQREFRGDSVVKILREAAHPRGVLLTLDEAQNLRVGVQTMEADKAGISATLELIHDGEIGAPVVLVAGGLGSTESVLESFGVSRIAYDNICYLGPLGLESTQAVIEDWLVWGGGVPEDHPHLDVWTKTLAAESHGWPQHIHVYAQSAARWLDRHNSQITPDVPDAVLAEAWQKRQDYYAKRADKLEESDRRSLANLLLHKGKGHSLTKTELLDALSGPRADEVFSNGLVHKGVVAQTANGGYVVSVPPMFDWLVETWADTAPSLTISTQPSARRQLRPPDAGDQVRES